MSTTRIHIIGSGPRTGTTLLYEVMKTCSNVNSVSDHEASICVSNTALGGRGIIISKYPVEIDVVYRPMLVNPNLYVICLIRDPRDMVVSYHGAYPDIYWSSLKFWHFFLKYYNRLKDHPRFHIIKYEDFVRMPDKVQTLLSKKIPILKPIHNFSDYHLYAEPSLVSSLALKDVRPITPKGIGSWKNHLARIKQQIKVHEDISESLFAFGYEKDKKWLELLKGVEEKNFETKTGEYFKQGELSGRSKRMVLAVSNMLVERFGGNPEKLFKPIKFAYKKLNLTMKFFIL